MSVVVPGDRIGKNDNYSYKIEDEEHASILAFETPEGLKPINGPYMPKEGDLVIAKVVAAQPLFWIASFNGYDAKLSSSNVIKGVTIDEGTYIRAKIISTKGGIELSMKFKETGILNGGTLVYVGNKINKFIERNEEVLNKIREVSGCEITYGMNGYIWIRGKEEGVREALKWIADIDNYYYSSKLKEVINKLRYV